MQNCLMLIRKLQKKITQKNHSVAASDLLLRLGEYDVSNEKEPFGYLERRVQIIAAHPQFDPKTFENDLALLRFYEKVPFRRNVVPVCIPESNSSFVNSWATVTGWGRLYEGAFAERSVRCTGRPNF